MRISCGRLMRGMALGLAALCPSSFTVCRAQSGPSREPASEPAATSRSVQRPNIVIFLIDTLRADRVGAYGYKKHDSTPNIDALARSGVVFEQAYGAAPWTVPSVASLFTSTFALEHSHILKRSKLNEKFTTLAQHLSANGYVTYSLFTNFFLAAEFGMTRGFMVSGPIPWVNGENLATVYNKIFRTPQFLYIHNLEPHTPWVFAAEESPGYQSVDKEARSRIKAVYDAYKDRLAVDSAAGRPIGTTAVGDEIAARLRELDQNHAAYSELYDLAVHEADDKVGSVIAELKRREIWDQTIFILISDHGEELGEHGGWLHGQSLYEEQVRVPMIIRFPGEAHSGLRISAPVSGVDIAPTILELIGAKAGADTFRGRSLMELIRNPQTKETEPRVVSVRRNQSDYYKLWHEQRGETNIAARMGDWKAIWNVDTHTLELYDLKTDPGERINRTGTEQQVAETLRSFLIRFFERTTARAVPVQVAIPRDETKRNIRNLGYVD